MQSKSDLEFNTVKCSEPECDISVLHESCSPAASDVEFEHHFNLAFESTTPIAAVSSVFSSPSDATNKIPSNSSNVSVEVTASCTASSIALDDNNRHEFPDEPYCNLMDQLLQELHPTDRGHFPVDITGDNALLLKTFIVEHGSCRPPGPFPRVVDPGRQYNRCFSETHYTTKNKAGVEIPTLWLCYSPKLDAAYCEPCWLFASRSDHTYRPAWSSGMRNWRDLGRKVA